MSLLRLAAGVKRLDRIRNEYIRSYLGVHQIGQKIEEKQTEIAGTEIR